VGRKFESYLGSIKKSECECECVDTNNTLILFSQYSHSNSHFIFKCTHRVNQIPGFMMKIREPQMIARLTTKKNRNRAEEQINTGVRSCKYFFPLIFCNGLNGKIYFSPFLRGHRNLSYIS